MCHAGIFMELSLSSGQSLGIGPAAVEHLLKGVAAALLLLQSPCFSESTPPFAYALNVLAAVM